MTHRVEMRLGGVDGQKAKFELTVEREKDGKWDKTDEVQTLEVDPSSAPQVMLLEEGERIVLVPVVRKTKVVFDRVQNANVVVNADEEGTDSAQPKEPEPEKEPEAPNNAQPEGGTAPAPKPAPTGGTTGVGRSTPPATAAQQKPLGLTPQGGANTGGQGSKEV